jgi:hypothetical protein
MCECEREGAWKTNLNQSHLPGMKRDPVLLYDDMLLEGKNRYIKSTQKMASISLLRGF